MALAVPREATLVESRQPSTASEGQTMLGASESMTSMSWVQTLALPQSSVAVQTRSMLRSAGQVPGMTVSVKVTVTFVSHTSMAMAVPREATFVESRQPSTASAGQTMLGASESMTSMSWVQTARLPQSSVAVQTRSMVDSAGQVPGVTVSAKVTATLVSHTSMALAVPREATLVESRQPSTASEGQTMLGASESMTSMVWVQTLRGCRSRRWPSRPVRCCARPGRFRG